MSLLATHGPVPGGGRPGRRPAPVDGRGLWRGPSLVSVPLAALVGTNPTTRGDGAADAGAEQVGRRVDAGQRVEPGGGGVVPDGSVRRWGPGARAPHPADPGRVPARARGAHRGVPVGGRALGDGTDEPTGPRDAARSEERRVGKEC